MEKKDLKKLALLGMAGGLLLSAQAVNANEVSAQDYSNYLAAKGCASCGGHKQAQKGKNTKDSEVADNYVPGSSHGCGGSRGYYNQQGCGGASGGQGYYYNQGGSSASHGCGGQWREISADQYQQQQGSQGQGQYQQDQNYQYQNQPGSTSQYQQTTPRSYNK